jgi:hypothetical protein
MRLAPPPCSRQYGNASGNVKDVAVRNIEFANPGRRTDTGDVQIVAPALLKFGRHESAKADAYYRRSVGNFKIAETFKGSLCGDLWITMQKRRPNKSGPRKPAAQQFLELEDGAARTAME